MRVERIDEPIKVRADFQGGTITPLLFRRGTQDHRVVVVNARWEDREGTQKLHFFSVTVTSGDVYQLRLESGDMLWTLESVMMDG
jgi:hypothetical protein